MATASNKLWEFAARGIPVAVPDTPDYRETLGEEAWVAFYGLEDPASLANAIVRLTASQKEYREASQAAYEAVRSKYNFESVFPPVLSGLLAATSNSDSHHALEQSSPIVFD
jgi:spore maturation protein CgeB